MWFTQLRWAAAHHYLEPCTFEVEVSSDASSWQHVSCGSIQVLCPVFPTCLHTGKPRRIREFGGIALNHSLLCMTEQVSRRKLLIFRESLGAWHGLVRNKSVAIVCVFYPINFEPVVNALQLANFSHARDVFESARPLLRTCCGLARTDCKYRCCGDMHLAEGSPTLRDSLFTLQHQTRLYVPVQQEPCLNQATQGRPVFIDSARLSAEVGAAHPRADCRGIA